MGWLLAAACLPGNRSPCDFCWGRKGRIWAKAGREAPVLPAGAQLRTAPCQAASSPGTLLCSLHEDLTLPQPHFGVIFTQSHISLRLPTRWWGAGCSPLPCSATEALAIPREPHAELRTCSFCTSSQTTFLSRRRCRSETSSTWWKTCGEKGRGWLGPGAASLPRPSTLLQHQHLRVSAEP